MLFSGSTWDMAVWLAGAIALWCLASIPAYWFLGAWLTIRAALDGVLAKLVRFFGDLRRDRRESRARTGDGIRARMRVTAVDKSLLEAWTAALASAFDAIQTGSRQVEQARAFAAAALKKIEPLGRRLQRLELMSEALPDVPTVDQALLRTKRNRLAIVNLLLAVILLIPIAVVNAQLTGLVLNEFIPPVQPVFGIPVSFVLAVVLVIAEAGIGLLHSAEAERHQESERRLTLGVLVWSAAALGVIGLETTLYSQVNAGAMDLELSLGGSAFGLMGAILGASVFGLGRLAHSSLATIRKDRTPRVIAKQLVQLRHAADDWNAAAQRLGPAQQAATDGCQQLVAACRQIAEAERASLDSFKLEVERCKEFPPVWATPVERTLTDSEFSERESAAYLWSAVAVLATLSLAGLAGAFASRMSLWPSLALGIGGGSLAFATGALAASIKPRPAIARAAVGLSLWIATAAGVALVGRILRGEVNVFAWILLVPATATYIAGYMVGDTIALLRLPLMWVTDTVSYAACALAAALMWLLAAITAVIEYAARLVAWPTTLLVAAWSGRRSRESLRAASV